MSKKKVLVIGPFWDATGWSVAAQRIALGLDANSDLDVVCRNVKLATQNIEPYSRIQELCKKDIDNVDVNIQIVLPHMLCYKAGMKNIAVVFLETTNFLTSGWKLYLNQMDSVWVASEENKQSVIASHVTKPCHVIPLPCDPQEYTTLPEPPPWIKTGSNRYVFYTISDYSSRKNLRGLIKAYLEEFGPRDNVVLVLKTYLENKTGQQSMELIWAEIEDIKKSLRKNCTNIYPPIIIITNYLTNDQIKQIHAAGDVYIVPEKGTAFCLPAFDAMAYNKPVITNGWCAPNQFIKDGINGHHLSYRMERVHGMKDCTYQNLYSCYEEWAQPDMEQLKALMRAYYTSKPILNNKENLEEWSYKAKTDILTKALE